MQRYSKVDLHTHSTYSDGKNSVEELIIQALEKNIRALSLTDHDTIEGVLEAKYFCEEAGIHFIPGVELSVSFKHPMYMEGNKSFEVHLLGYDFNIYNSALFEHSKKCKLGRTKRAIDIFHKLNYKFETENITPFSEEEINFYIEQHKGMIGRPHLAQILIDEEIVDTREEAFDKYLRECDVEKNFISFEEGSELIRAAGGKAVIAHPHANRNGSLMKAVGYIQDPDERNRLRIKLFENVAPHLDGIECYFYGDNKFISNIYRQIAHEHGWIFTGGSDHHGEGLLDRLGIVSVPEECFYFFRPDVFFG